PEPPPPRPPGDRALVPAHDPGGGVGAPPLRGARPRRDRGEGPRVSRCPAAGRPQPWSGPGSPGRTSPVSYATTSCARSRASSFVIARLTWVLTVAGLRYS